MKTLTQHDELLVKPYIDSKIQTLAKKRDITNTEVTGTTNNSGASIPARKYFYFNGRLAKATALIAVNATLTENTNFIYADVRGGLEDFRATITNMCMIFLSSGLTNKADFETALLTAIRGGLSNSFCGFVTCENSWLAGARTILIASKWNDDLIKVYPLGGVVDNYKQGYYYSNEWHWS